MGFPKASKNGEKRLAVLPKDLLSINNVSALFFEKGYASEHGIEDSEYEKYGANIAEREQVLSKDIICDPKIGDATYLDELKDGTIIWGWIHAVQNPKLAKLLVEKYITVYAWEDMYEEGRHLFYKNNILAGKASIKHALLHYGSTGNKLKVAVLGKGNVAFGACESLYQLGAEVTVYGRKNEQLFRRELLKYDVLVNAILWDTKRLDHIIYEKDVKAMKPHTLIIDISCDENGAIETSYATSISDPIYVVHDVFHYAVDNTPSLLYRDATSAISEVTSRFADDLIEAQHNQIFSDSCIISDGQILDQRIIDYQKLHPDQ
ncbi:N(5)-(carboxyethyl)ornithine synthase [Globicatella sulfidifaciens]|uniref:N(5)-(Carboxyethyl)ornithine synthase n=1 Tax=Globicatella sulfidifaciens TaxID=136093 RepID=A0A7X8C4W6_9LACT|nr:N(5)-(carboxyethyl)ornithine synthase [Globicatella sulfidifaciens]NLJ18844.1 N(5)-(carboxyethyl)ornithine synthase [Globicatella sulfidifaciens]